MELVMELDYNELYEFYNLLLGEKLTAGLNDFQERLLGRLTMALRNANVKNPRIKSIVIKKDKHT